MCDTLCAEAQGVCVEAQGVCSDACVVLCFVVVQYFDGKNGVVTRL